MEYHFLDPGDEKLLALAELPLEGGITVALRTTSFDAAKAEIVALTLEDFDGQALFDQRVKPQNVEAWEGGEASGGITPESLANAPELYQFEEELSGIFENAVLVVSLHSTFLQAMMDASWISLPPYASLDLTDFFLATHSTPDAPREPATTASLQTIAAYYGENPNPQTLEEEAAVLGACYKKFVAEMAAQRDDKGQAHWDAYNQRLAEASKADAQTQKQKRLQALKTTRINALLWLCAGAIFLNLAVQVSLRTEDMGIPIMVGAVGVFFLYKWIRCLITMYKLSKQRP